MKRNKSRFLIYWLFTFIVISCAFSISVSMAVFVDTFIVNTNVQPFTDTTTNNFVCYPLTNDDDIVAIGWAKDPTEGTGALTIPAIVTDSESNEYTVKAIVKSGFRYCGFTTIDFEDGNVIEEIQEEAFYSNQNLTLFTYPEHCVKGIAPSQFMDCRKLEKVDMTDTINYIETQKGTSGWLATHHFDIGDHAFSSCVKLKGFTFPTSISDIGHSAFHNCPNIYGIFFPDDNGVTTISIGKYAFADCTNFAICYLGTNASYIDSYAFAKCEKLKIYYQGNPNTPGDPMSSYDEDFRKKHVATNQTHTINDYVPIEYDVSAMTMDDDHPGIIYIKQRGPILYDGSVGSTIELDSSTDEYITIFQWYTPTVESDDYDAENDILTIPSTIAGAPVKRIATHAFDADTEGNEPLKGVIFNPELVQICQEAFKKCNQLATIDFSNCVALKEIGHKAFLPNISNGNTKNQACLSIELPNSLVYLGNYAFQNFTKVRTLSLFDTTDTPHLKIIGAATFKNLGSEVDSQYKGKIDLILPYSLADGEIHRAKPTGYDTAAEYSVGNESFMNCPLLKTVTMQYHPTHPNAPSTTNSKTNGNTRTGIGKQAFSNCQYLLRFKANKAFMRCGEGLFEKCSSLKEIFFSAALGDNENMFTWGWGEGNSIFFIGDDSDDVEFRDVVIYVDSSQEPTARARQDKYYVWNSDPKTYRNDYAMSTNTNVYAPTKNNGDKVSDFRNDTVISRTNVTTYFSVDYHNNAVKYVNPSDGTVSTTPDYSNSIAFINKSNKYTLTRCYATGLASIDMSSWNLGSSYPIDTIGSCAFATRNNNANPASKIILPSTVTTIKDRAFYSVNNDGINIVTYKLGGNEVVDSGSPAKTNVCFLPSTVTKIEKFAFYNNDFQKVALPSALTFLGNTAFTAAPGKTSTIESFGIASGTSSAYSYIDSGIVDKSTNTLLYYASVGTGNSPTLDLSTSSWTSLKAIGPRALANTNYTSITLPSGLTTIYGAAFSSNTALTTVSGFTGLKYIAAAPQSGDTDVYNNDGNFDVSDYTEFNRPNYFNWLAKFGAFANCTNLSTFDFTSCNSSLRKIGYGAFEGCTSLSSMTGGSTTYTYYRYSDYTNMTTSDVEDRIAAQNAVKEEKTTNVLDLSEATNMTSIGRGAFKGCSSIKYAHLPILQSQNTGNTVATQAKFYMGMDLEDKASWYSRRPANGDNSRKPVFEGCEVANTGALLVGESAVYASPRSSTYLATKSLIGNDIDQYDKTQYEIDRYPTAIMSSGKTYFYVRNDSPSTDYLTNFDGADVKYWTYIGNANTHRYLLFENRSQMKAYFGL